MSVGQVTLMLSGSPGTVVTTRSENLSMVAAVSVASIPGGSGGAESLEQGTGRESLWGLNADRFALEGNEIVVPPGQQSGIGVAGTAPPLLRASAMTRVDELGGQQGTGAVVHQHQVDLIALDAVCQRFQRGWLAAEPGAPPGTTSTGMAPAASAAFASSPGRTTTITWSTCAARVAIDQERRGRPSVPGRPCSSPPPPRCRLRRQGRRHSCPSRLQRPLPWPERRSGTIMR